MTKIVLDTNVFSHKKFCEWLKDSDHNACISTIGYTELLYHYLKKKGKNTDFVEVFLDTLNVQVIPYDEECARIASEAAIGRWDFRQKARDYMIGSVSVKMECPVVTSNKRDFEWVGEVYSPDEFLRG
ncbi:MAG: type II toxin-antitoxin system VapC family toxin [Archaeoglobaceae archaeon]